MRQNILFHQLTVVVLSIFIVGMIGSAIAASAASTNNQPYVAGYGKDGNSFYRSDEGFLRTFFSGKNS